MKRGVVQLNNDTKTQLKALDISKFPEPLAGKIESLTESVFYVELSAEEVELILDQLPTPDQATPAINQLRFQLSQIMS